MTLTQILLIVLCILSVGFLVMIFGMLVLACRIDELRDFPLSKEDKNDKR